MFDCLIEFMKNRFSFLTHVKVSVATNFKATVHGAGDPCGRNHPADPGQDRGRHRRHRLESQAQRESAA